ncbi:Glycosyltransferase AER61, uncharacterized [Nannochloropsis gaditana]|uniref:Glycosyltransferase AER61, uncharacterized n=1 Tax=Nannochloropsis gaditana TaxID=72520 RepID=W7T0D5_9STRA|nr:Glycosyltransferase AER61, uncharacterized [Nannochloropsis gaditana]
MNSRARYPGNTGLHMRRPGKRDRLIMAIVLLLVMYYVLEARQKTIFDGMARTFDAKFDVVRKGATFRDNSCTSNQGDVPIFRTEAELMVNRPRHFHRMMDFDYALEEEVFDRALGGVVELHDAYVLSPHQIAFNCDTIYIPRGCKAGAISNDQILSQITPLMSREGKRDTIGESRTALQVQELDTAVIIAQFWGGAYYHALIEDFPRLAFVLGILQSNPQATILSYPQSLMRPTSRIQIWNKLLGLGDDRKWVPFEENTVYSVKKLFIPTATRCGRGQPKALRLIRDRIFDKVPSVLGKTLEQFWAKYPQIRDAEKMLIVVQKRSSRSLLNHDKLVEALASEFADRCTVVEFLGSESMEEAIVMHHQAKVIVGPHGAGLSNSLFARVDAALVEIHPKVGNFNGTGVNRCHQWTAKSLGLETRMLVQSSGQEFGCSFFVDVQSVVGTVHELLDGLL